MWHTSSTASTAKRIALVIWKVSEIESARRDSPAKPSVSIWRQRVETSCARRAPNARSKSVSPPLSPPWPPPTSLPPSPPSPPPRPHDHPRRPQRRHYRCARHHASTAPTAAVTTALAAAPPSPPPLPPSCGPSRSPIPETFGLGPKFGGPNLRGGIGSRPLIHLCKPAKSEQSVQAASTRSTPVAATRGIVPPPRH